ncbi:MAG: alkylhydroperoxidase [delta proteobacterium MLS_D]|jgi:AhpD family alkylhydroperoxidase|nr:MAG: alkylhydroperoxidase [delta proteobacterium MLS_D]
MQVIFLLQKTQNRSSVCAGIILQRNSDSMTEYKRKFSISEMYRAFMMLPSVTAGMIENKRKKLVGGDFIERVHLAVTEVNGCAVCSYAHTYLALRQGMSNEEIKSFLSGDGNFVRSEEAKAILFAQHFADARGLPKKEAYESIVDEYGEVKAKIILSAVQLMTVGNMFGIPFSAFQSRLRGRPYTDSSLIYEAGVQVAGAILVPIGFVHGVIRMVGEAFKSKT